ncbi:uncharacterized protein SPSK_04440 [Sporothrix schenckii 1099-18]|uniref:Uncharacterized protein n=1 Tax=Sporothrix schenckii 1099-18 TaxID=1397361 RepID=A0A0F2LZY7_SPOSC|nr:uncharacterized protein SPSK_04440 [Sporothrix schenckii 1099-18]KJR83012.1 hypothetical protein SPSK_04440 [Sporothrix schenckii 1099-18]
MRRRNRYTRRSTKKEGARNAHKGEGTEATSRKEQQCPVTPRRKVWPAAHRRVSQGREGAYWVCLPICQYETLLWKERPSQGPQETKSNQVKDNFAGVEAQVWKLRGGIVSKAARVNEREGANGPRKHEAREANGAPGACHQANRPVEWPWFWTRKEGELARGIRRGVYGMHTRIRTETGGAIHSNNANRHGKGCDKGAETHDTKGERETRGSTAPSTKADQTNYTRWRVPSFLDTSARHRLDWRTLAYIGELAQWHTRAPCLPGRVRCDGPVEQKDRVSSEWERNKEAKRRTRIEKGWEGLESI